MQSLITDLTKVTYAHMDRLIDNILRGYMSEFFISFLNWCIVDLQCSINFCCTSKWFSYIYICIIYNFDVQQKLTEHCKLTVLQFLKDVKKFTHIYIYIYTFFLIVFFPVMIYHSILNRIPYAIQ